MGRGRVRSLVFEDRLLGVLVRRLPPTEAKVLSEQLEKAKEGEAGKLVQDAFKAAVVFPEATLPSGATGEAYERARRMTPNAFTSTLPMKFVNMLGADGGDRAYRRARATRLAAFRLRGAAARGAGAVRGGARHVHPPARAGL